MKNYLKPTLVFAAASAGSPSTCLVQVDMDFICCFTYLVLFGALFLMPKGQGRIRCLPKDDNVESVSD